MDRCTHWIACAFVAACALVPTAARVRAQEGLRPPELLGGSAPLRPSGDADPHPESEVVVALRLTIDAVGLVTDAALVAGDDRVVDPAFGAAAVAYVRSIRFRPALRDGVPVPAAIAFEVRFAPRALDQATGASSSTDEAPQQPTTQQPTLPPAP